MNRNIKFGVTLGIIFLVFGVIVFFANSSVSVKKNVGSKEFLMTRGSIDSMYDVIKTADLIVTGEVVGDAENVMYDFASDIGVSEEVKNTDLNAFKIALAISEIKIDEILYGNEKNEKILLAQIGKAGNDIGETKVKKGDKMLLVLKKHKGSERLYASTVAEEGLFIEKSNGYMYSLSDNKFTSKYDHLKKDILVSDIKLECSKIKEFKSLND